MPASNAQAGVDGKVLVALGDLFGLNFYPLPRLPGPSSCRVASLVTWAMTITSVPSANRSHSELSELSGVAHLNHERAEEKEGTQSHDERQPAPPPEQVRARQCKADPCHHPPKWRAPGVNARRNSSGKANAAQSEGCRPPRVAERAGRELGCGVTTVHVGTAVLGCSVERSSTRFARNNWRSAAPPDSTWPVLADEVEDTFQVIGLRKQIHQMRLLHSISGLEQANQVAREGCGIA